MDAPLDLTHGESLTLEFKRHRSQRDMSESELVEAVVCLANGEGGRLVLGVEDDGTVTGFGPLPVSTHSMAAFIRNRTRPNVVVKVEAVEVGDATVVVVDVPDIDSVVGTSSGTYKRRALRADGTPECIPFLPEEMLSAGLFAAQQDYAALPAQGAAMTDLSPVEFSRFRNMCAKGNTDGLLAQLDDIEICRALRLLTLGTATPQPTIGAILLFGTEDALRRWVPTVEYQFQVRADDDSLTRNDVLCAPAFAAFERLEGLIDAVNDEQEVMVGLTRVPVPRIPLEVAREAVANALVHRDYTEMGATRVSLGPSAMTVVNPGGLPRGVSLVNLLEASVPRSPILAEAFRRAGLVDRAGRGVQRMFRAQLLAGRDAPDYSGTDSTTVRVDIPTRAADLDMVRFVAAYQDGAARSLPLVEIRLLHALRGSGRMKASELGEDLQVTPAVVKAAATHLVEKGLIEQVGAGRQRAYALGAAFYAAAEDRNAYVRIRAADPLQQRQMILQYVDAYGSITRGQAADLCSVTALQARNLLKKLVEAGELALIGERRAARYIRAPR